MAVIIHHLFIYIYITHSWLHFAKSTNQHPAYNDIVSVKGQRAYHKTNHLEVDHRTYAETNIIEGHIIAYCIYAIRNMFNTLHHYVLANFVIDLIDVTCCFIIGHIKLVDSLNIVCFKTSSVLFSYGVDD